MMGRTLSSRVTRRKRVKGPPQVSKLVTKCHETLFPHVPMLEDTKEVLDFAQPGCRFCYGTGIAGMLQMDPPIGEYLQPLVCCCTLKTMHRLRQEEDAMPDTEDSSSEPEVKISRRVL